MEGAETGTLYVVRLAPSHPAYVQAATDVGCEASVTVGVVTYQLFVPFGAAGATVALVDTESLASVVAETPVLLAESPAPSTASTRTVYVLIGCEAGHVGARPRVRAPVLGSVNEDLVVVYARLGIRGRRP